MIKQFDVTRYQRHAKHTRSLNRVWCDLVLRWYCRVVRNLIPRWDPRNISRHSEKSIDAEMYRTVSNSGSSRTSSNSRSSSRNRGLRETMNESNALWLNKKWNSSRIKRISYLDLQLYIYMYIAIRIYSEKFSISRLYTSDRTR